MVPSLHQAFFKGKLGGGLCAESQLEVQQAEVGLAVYGRRAQVEQGNAVLAAVSIEPVYEEHYGAERVILGRMGGVEVIEYLRFYAYGDRGCYEMVFLE